MQYKPEINVLIICPFLDSQGGVANYYNLFKNNFKSEYVKIEFMEVGSRNYDISFNKRLLNTIKSIKIIKEKTENKNVVVINPSLDTNSLIRDGLFNIIINRIYKKKTIVFFRGWDLKTEKNIDKYFKTIFRFFFHSNKTIVLSETFKRKLINWGFPACNIIIETTTYKGEVSQNVISKFNLIFMSRFAKGKGGLEAIQTVEHLISDYPDMKLFMVGDGSEAQAWKEYVNANSLTQNIIFTGWLTGDRKKSVLENCSIMLYPTDYGEGLPNSLLEGMGYGLAIVTRPVAGIPEVVKDGINGFIVNSRAPRDFAQVVKLLIEDHDLLKEISCRNRKEAANKFEISSVTKRLEKIYMEF